MSQKTKQATRALWNTLWVLGIGGFLFLLTSAKGIFQVTKIKGVEVTIQELDDGYFFISDSLLHRTIVNKFGDQLKNRNIADLDESQIEDFLKNDSFIKNAEVYISPRGVLKVQVDQRQPLARVFSQISGSYYIDTEGYKIPLSKMHTVRTTVISGDLPLWKSGEHVSKNPELQKVFTLCKSISDDEFLSLYIDEIYVQPNGQMALIPKIGNFKIKIKDCSDVELKLRNLKTFLTEVVAHDHWNSFSQINIDYKNQVVATKRTD